MKKLINLLIIISFLFMSLAFADGYGKLRVKISGPIKNNKYFLCISGMGCLSLLAAKKGKMLPMEGALGNIVAMNATNMHMYPQRFPQSCEVSVSSNKTLTISAKLVEGRNDKIYLSNLRCSVA